MNLEIGTGKPSRNIVESGDLEIPTPLIKFFPFFQDEEATIWTVLYVLLLLWLDFVRYKTTPFLVTIYHGFGIKQTFPNTNRTTNSTYV